MKKTINLWDFQDAFYNMNRQDQFSYEGQKALYEFLTELEEENGIEEELDVIALCCEFTEFESIEELKNDYNDIESMDDLENRTIIIMIDDESFIIQNY